MNIDLGNLLRREEIAARAGISLSGWNRLVQKGVAPQPLRFRQNCVLWDADVVDAWIETYKKWERRAKTSA